MSEYSSTATRILDVTQKLIQTRGYHSISFNDISLEVGIKKPSVIHHFANKSELGVAVVIRYREEFNSHLGNLANTPNISASELFNAYCEPYLDMGESGDKICLCGSLGSEFTVLPENLQTEVSVFFKQHVEWIKQILELGIEDGSFSVKGDIKAIANHILNTLHGALMVKRATGDDLHLKTTVNLIKTSLTAA